MSEFNEKNENKNSVENDNSEILTNISVPSVDSTEGDPLKYPKKQKSISLKSCVVTVVALVLAAVMLTYTVCSSVYKQRLAEAYLGGFAYGEDDGFGKLELLRLLFEKYSYLDVDDEVLLDIVIREYVASTGDRYAEYYNEQEYRELMMSSSGSSVGVGITVVYTDLTVDGTEHSALEILEVSYGSPAYEAGVKAGDFIISVGHSQNETPLDDMDYSEALDKLKGEEGTVAEFSVYREKDAGFEKLHFSIERKIYETPSVTCSVSALDSNVGIVKISKFNYNTPKQFSEAVDSLIESGCENFVFDVRSNPGGNLDSVVAILSYFLLEDDVILSTVDGNGNKEITRVKEITDRSGELIDCNVSKEDIGKYRESISKMAVLCNGSSASAAELFTAALRDYDLATIVGTKTFGKGSMQTIFSLAPFGYTGGLKMTTKMYFPPSDQGYDGIGIHPDDEYYIELSEEALKHSIYELPEELDDQLKGALRSFEK